MPGWQLDIFQWNWTTSNLFGNNFWIMVAGKGPLKTRWIVDAKALKQEGEKGRI